MKLTNLLLAGFLIVSCGENKSGSNSSNATMKNGWTELRLDELKASCASDLYSRKGSDRVTPDASKRMCSCYFDDISRNYSYYEDPPTQYLLDTAHKCATDTGLKWDEQSGVSLVDGMTEKKASLPEIE